MVDTEALINQLRAARKADTYTPGSMTKFIHALPDAQLKQRAIELVNLHDHELDCGRHGDPKAVAKHFDVPQDILDQVHEGLSTDAMTRDLLARRGDDSTLPIPEPDRRDILAAALGAHNSSLEDI